MKKFMFEVKFMGKESEIIGVIASNEIVANQKLMEQVKDKGILAGITAKGVECEEKEISYREYKTNPEYIGLRTKANSYNAEKKTIVVLIEKVYEEEKLSVEQVADILIAKSDEINKNGVVMTREMSQEFVNMVKKLCDENHINPKELTEVINQKKGEKTNA